MPKRKLKKSVWLPLILAVYAIAMTFVFGRTLLEEGMKTKFWVSVGAEGLVIIALYFALRRKERLSNQWDENKKNRS